MNPNDRRHRSKDSGGLHLYLPSRIRLDALWILPNAPPAKGQEAFMSWEPALEVVPCIEGRPFC